MTKMIRQLNLYDHILRTTFHGPKELMRRFGISRRMLQRDLKDLRDCGLIKLKYDAKTNNYISDGDPVFDDGAPARRRQHLIRLYRLGTLISKLTSVDSEALLTYRSSLREYEEFVEEYNSRQTHNASDPADQTEDTNDYGLDDFGLDDFGLDDLTPEDMYEYYLKNAPDLGDLKAEYYALFPGSNERTRQRDFHQLREAGFDIYYDSALKRFIYEVYANEYEEDYF